MEKTVLLVTAIEGAENLARALSREADAVVEIAHSRRAALARLRRDPVTVVVLDSSLPDTEITTSDILWQNSGEAVPVEVNLSALGASGVVRLLRNLMDGRRQAEVLGRREAIITLGQELQSTITSLLLQSDLLLRDRSLSPETAEKVREMKELADSLRLRLRGVTPDGVHLAARDANPTSPHRMTASAMLPKRSSDAGPPPVP